MSLNSFTVKQYLAALLLAALSGAAGCPLVTPLPDELDVSVSATNKQAAPRDSGPPSLANTTWSIARVADPNEPAVSDPPPGPYGGILNGGLLQRPPAGEQFALVTFGPSGQAVLVDENDSFLSDIYGRSIAISSEWHTTTLPGIEYRSASYGLDFSDRFGVAILVQVRLGTTYVGRAILYAWGTRSEDQISGTFGYLLDFRGGLGERLGSSGDQYPITGTRVE